jgi:hypothetical protein
MLKTKPILKFLLLFVLSYGILIAIFPLLRDQTSNYLIALGNNFLHQPIHNSLVSFHKTNGKMDVEMRFGNITKQVNGHVPSFLVKFSSSDFLYLPFALLIALIIASPVSIKRKLLSLSVEILLLHLLLMLRIYMMILYVCSQNLSLELVTPGPLLKKFIDWMQVNFVDYGATILFIIVFIWIAVTFRKEDLSLIRVTPKNKVLSTNKT